MTKQKLSTKPVRCCQSMHECCVCMGTIRLGQFYYDGGFGRRAHVECIVNPNDELTDTTALAPDPMSEMILTRNESTTVGGCNGCKTHTSERGAIPHDVTVVELRSIGFRLCDRGREKLITLLKQARPKRNLAHRCGKGEGLADTLDDGSAPIPQTELNSKSAPDS